MTTDSAFIDIEVAYAPPQGPVLVYLRLPQGARVEDAIRGSGILERCPEIKLDDVHVGIYGRLVALQEPLRDRDRVEIYRSLVLHARDARRRRVRERKARTAAAAGGIVR